MTYVTRSFLDYRIPVIAALDRLLSGKLHVLFSSDYVPPRVTAKARAVLGDRAIGMTGEKRLGPNSFQGFANRALRFVYQPGIFNAIASTKPDVLVGDGFYQWTSFALAYKLLHRMPLVVCYEKTFHTERNVQRFRTLYRRYVLNYVDAMSVNGRLCREYSEWIGMAPERITTGHMTADTYNLERLVGGVDPSTLDTLRTKWGNPNLVFITVGQLIRRKGIGELLGAWKKLEKTLSIDCRLVIIGGGPMESTLRRQAHEADLRSILFLGRIDYDAIAPYYAAADVFVMPTLEDNWSLVVPEAMACGLPVLCSKYNGCYPELIEPGGNGWVFDPLDQADTFNALKRCVENKERLKQMGQKSKEIISKHTPEHAAQAIYDACKIAIAHHRKNRHAHSFRS